MSLFDSTTLIMSSAFIVLEGPDGSGTTRHSELLAKRLRSRGNDVVLTAEPTEGQYGREVHDAIRSRTPRSPAEIQKLFCLDRADHVELAILPALDAEKIVVCDRYVPSTIIYGEASGVSRDQLEQWNAAFPKPDVLLILLPPFEVCWERVGRRKSHDSFEKEAFQRIVYKGYEKYAEDHSEAIVVDTSGRKQDAAERIWDFVGGIAS
jgi:dTMP kinase